MNYRRGLQRVYAVLTVAWITLILFNALSDRWKPRDSSGWVVESERPIAQVPEEFKKLGFKPVVTPEEFLARENARQRWIRTVSLSLLPPALLYFLLFHVSRWVYRGFTPATHK